LLLLLLLVRLLLLLVLLLLLLARCPLHLCLCLPPPPLRSHAAAMPSWLTAAGAKMRFDDLVAHPSARWARLQAPKVLALRLYTTAAFVEINAPLRQLNGEGSQCRERFPFPNSFVSSQARSNHVPESGTAHRKASCPFRGFRDLKVSGDFLVNFLERGGLGDHVDNHARPTPMRQRWHHDH
jgi:hypothetical protein